MGTVEVFGKLPDYFRSVPPFYLSYFGVLEFRVVNKFPDQFYRSWNQPCAPHFEPSRFILVVCRKRGEAYGQPPSFVRPKYTYTSGQGYRYEYDPMIPAAHRSSTTVH